jgi:hypothetical protein
VFRGADSSAGGDPRLAGCHQSNLRRITLKSPLIATRQVCRPLCSLFSICPTTRRHNSAVRSHINVCDTISYTALFATEKIYYIAWNCNGDGIKLAQILVILPTI